ncbi:TIR domain-containing protein [Metallumcola ferriviriculae]|uniref:TIR domain-containing protein n=1 Tax=Metallumcola ferriviriculae TaxID=3039180 RepID=UPI003D16066B
MLAKKRVFISFAIQDVRYRDLLKGQALNTNSPFEYVDMSAKKAWDSKWKTNCRTRIKGCGGVIALISKHTRLADGAKWEMQCANYEGIPMIGVHIHKDDKGQISPQLAGRKVIEWKWEGIKKFINSI